MCLLWFCAASRLRVAPSTAHSEAEVIIQRRGSTAATDGP